MNVTLSTLASQQTRGTKLTEADANKFLNYCATHPDATIRYYPSDMILKVHSDASYNSEPKARSRAGGTATPTMTQHRAQSLPPPPS
jgi:hypothetical protein